MKLPLVCALLLATASPALAQVGHPPQGSPYRDLEYKQSWTLFAGQFNSNTGAAHVGPDDAAMIGIRYDLRLGASPFSFTSRAMVADNDRTVIDPTRAASAREVGTTPARMLMLDVGLSFSLTGARSYHGFVPMISGGLGIARDLSTTTADAGGFGIGTPFALSFGAGIRWVPKGRLGLRADISNFAFKLSYPPAYFTPGVPGDPPVLGTGTGTSEWTKHVLLTLGVTYSFAR
ncbi:MAG TPA: hypothetical protein VFK13_02000 [Gemmatimonadaceae bacterium]|nr:hypothetical protein [Gemmatimonadaceae bacterium]